MSACPDRQTPDLFDTRDAFCLLAQDGVDGHAELARATDRRATEAAQTSFDFGPKQARPTP